MRVLVTGGYGFIGSNFIRFLLKNTGHEVVNLDALTYAGNRGNLEDYEGDSRYAFIHGRIENRELVNRVVEDVDYVVNFAAETHVDRSIKEPFPFLTTNVLGTQTLLEACKDSGVKRFLHISTDEVYGSLESDEGKFTEDLPLKPNSPYSASKAAVDMLVRAYNVTYGLPAVTVRPSNNYGYYQFPEKFIPLMITNLLQNKPVPVYGDGKNIRDWLFVEDCARGVFDVLMKGKEGEIYNLGGVSERRNIEVTETVLKIMGKAQSYIKFVKDRPGHDYRYALDITKVKSEVGWKPVVGFEEGLKKTVEWYRENTRWWKPLQQRLEKESKGFWS
ncbi:MAG TPA: dTDP-glucose 4,6-dehydratase [Euryarchaeota archaeon]|nr:dTDP-glucose 4,6-dehydratase [Euryarchaeota archaeon]